uniref:Ig-like domain-containing protein n=1 Tax=Podarcis muralis TaxID=64176 RepID=A0A670HRR5_PODMU
MRGRDIGQRGQHLTSRGGGLLPSSAGPLTLCPLFSSFPGSTSHSLRYFYTAVSEPGQGLPQFIDVGYVDDQQIIQYDSDTKEYLPRVPWMRKAEKEDPQYWHKQTQIAQGNQLAFRVSLQNLQNRYNQSRGIHTYQLMYGCELSSDGRKGGHHQYSYDGRDFIAFDKETLTWTAADTGAQVTKRKWDPDLAWNQGRKAYLEEICIEWLQRYLEYGNETLLRTGERGEGRGVQWGNYDGLETLVCQVHGFYPQEIEANWVKDGKVWQEGTLRGLVAPNSDGTYYLLLSVQIDPEERERFRCRVEHDSLEKPLDVAWEKEPGERQGGEGGEPVMLGSGGSQRGGNPFLSGSLQRWLKRMSRRRPAFKS